VRLVWLKECRLRRRRWRVPARRWASCPLWRLIGVLVTSLSTFAMPQRAAFIEHVGHLPKGRRDRAIANMKRINTGPDGAMFS
jgi:hypothetical protein